MKATSRGPQLNKEVARMCLYCVWRHEEKGLSSVFLKCSLPILESTEAASIGLTLPHFFFLTTKKMAS